MITRMMFAGLRVLPFSRQLRSIPALNTGARENIVEGIAKVISKLNAIVGVVRLCSIHCSIHGGHWLKIRGLPSGNDLLLVLQQVRG